MRKERREREEKGRSDSMDLSDTLINSKLLITDPALSAAPILSSKTIGNTLQKATVDHCLRLTMQCQHDQSHAFAPIIINNYLTELESLFLERERERPLLTVIFKMSSDSDHSFYGYFVSSSSSSPCYKSVSEYFLLSIVRNDPCTNLIIFIFEKNYSFENLIR